MKISIVLVLCQTFKVVFCHENLEELPKSFPNETIRNNFFPEKLDLKQIFEKASDEVGIPFGLRSVIYEKLNDIGFLKLKVANFSIRNFDESSPRDGHGGGCSDSFAVFGFLAFLLALVDLLIQLGVIMTGGRKKRSLTSVNDSPCNNDARSSALNEGTIASYSLLRGFLNSMDANNSSCSSRFFCDATREASKLGKVGTLFAKVASSNAQAWLESINPVVHKNIKEAGLTGIHTSCEIIYPCDEKPAPYKFPGLPSLNGYQLTHNTQRKDHF